MNVAMGTEGRELAAEDLADEFSDTDVNELLETGSLTIRGFSGTVYTLTLTVEVDD